MENSEILKSKVEAEYKAFLGKFRSLQLSTIGDAGRPECSYAPFVIDIQSNFYVYVSGLSNHTKNMRNDNRAGIMLIEDEDKAENIFSRKRLTFECEVKKIERSDDEWEPIMQLFDELAGEIMATLRVLSDFELMSLSPKSGLFVSGFAKAYEIHGENMEFIKHINPNS